MTSKLKAKILFQILSLAPMQESEAQFSRLAANGDVEAFWRFYEACLSSKPEMDEQVEKQGKVSFRMLRPAMDAVYRAPV